MQSEHIVHLRAAAEKRSRDTLARATVAFQALASAGAPVTVARVAAAGHVSRSWIYTQPALLEQIAEVAQRGRHSNQAIPAQQRASTASLLRRLELVHQRIAELTAENARLRDELARSYGALRTHGD